MFLLYLTGRQFFHAASISILSVFRVDLKRARRRVHSGFARHLAELCIFAPLTDRVGGRSLLGALSKLYTHSVYSCILCDHRVVTLTALEHRVYEIARKAF